MMQAVEEEHRKMRRADAIERLPVIVADDRYYRKAHSRGRIARLRDLPAS